jgi:hypothetical protein
LIIDMDATRDKALAQQPLEQFGAYSHFCEAFSGPVRLLMNLRPEVELSIRFPLNV